MGIHFINIVLTDKLYTMDADSKNDLDTR